MSTPVEETPTRIGDRYRLEERIGSGAMGAVWRGTDELLNRTVAVKELLAAAAAPTAAGGDALEESRQRIMREGRIGARLQHPHVISMFDVVLHDDRPWLVMEYLPSRSLAAVLTDEGPMDAREAARVGWQVADGLAAAHAAGVVHRDVKPGNVLMGDDGRVKLTDFGVSRAVDDVQLTRTGMIAGTPAFISPEVARGREPTAASDVFGLGATLYTAVEGQPPFGLDDNAYALLHRVATEQVRPPSHAGPLTALIMRLLSTDPADRPAAAQARDALAAVASGASIGASTGGPTMVLGPPRPPVGAPRPPGSRPVPGPGTMISTPLARPRSNGRQWTPVLLVLLALLLVGGGVGAVVLASTSGGQAPEPAALPATTAQEPSDVAPSPTPTVDPAPTPEPTVEAPAPDVTDPVGFVQGYYALLPENSDAAFAKLGPTAQAKSRGRGGFVRFYSGMRSMGFEDARKVSENIVEGVVVFDPRDRPVERHRYRFLIAARDGQMVIEDFEALG